MRSDEMRAARCVYQHETTGIGGNVASWLARSQDLFSRTVPDRVIHIPSWENGRAQVRKKHGERSKISCQVAKKTCHEPSWKAVSGST